jgi:exopolysaccharide biosynthesis WecB/TagA/CpsF family protein
MHPLLKRIKQTPEIHEQFHNSINQADYLCTVTSFVNGFSYQELRKKNTYYQNIDYFYSDGILSSIVFTLLLNKTIPRVSFDYGSFAKFFFETVEQFALPIFIIGSKEEQLKGAIHKFRQAYPNLNICGSHNGYFDDDEKMIKMINDSGAQYIVCGLGTPKQDVFAQKIKRALPNQVKQIYTCGGFIHQSVERVNYYPELINKYHLRWLYRATREPVVIKRLLTKYPLFGIYALIDRFKN